jgi:hypothetical protein
MKITSHRLNDRRITNKEICDQLSEFVAESKDKANVGWMVYLWVNDRDKEPERPTPSHFCVFGSKSLASFGNLGVDALVAKLFDLSFKYSITDVDGPSRGQTSPDGTGDDYVVMSIELGNSDMGKTNITKDIIGLLSQLTDEQGEAI